jgi:mono/diheme cytochrome c family protein
MLKSSLLLFSAALVVIACLPIAGHNPQAASSVSAQNAAPAGKNPVKPTAESQAHAKMLYARDCAFCHGDNGNGKNTMGLALDDWTNPNALANKTDSDLFAVIRNGKGDKMPAEDEGRANDSEVRNLVIYIRSLSKNQPPAPAAAPAPAAPPADAPAPAPAPPTN